MVFTTWWVCPLHYCFLGGSRHTALWGGGWAPLYSVLWEPTQGWLALWPGSLESQASPGTQVGPFCWLRWPEGAGTNQARTGPVHNASAGAAPKAPESTGPEQREENGSALCDAEKKCPDLDLDGLLGWCLGCQQLHRAKLKTHNFKMV